MKPRWFPTILLMILPGWDQVPAQAQLEPRVTPRIVGGTKSPADTYRWIVALANTGSSSLFSRQFCGGSLIDRNWVLTAAHCVEDRTSGQIQVIVGLTDLDDTSNAEIRRVRGIFIHPGYGDRGGDLFNDVALLHLKDPVDTITPIAYARSPGIAVPGLAVRALGWGDTRSTPRYPTELRMVDLNLVSLTTANASYDGLLRSMHIAARGDGKDTCKGDSGGPLFDEDGAVPGDPLLIGITSFGIGCATRSVPGIYANVGYFASWIDSFIGQTQTASPSLQVKGRGLGIRSGNRNVSRRNNTDFGPRMRGGRTRVQGFTLANGAGRLPLAIESVTARSEAFQVTSKPRYLFSGRSGTLRVRYRASRRQQNGSDFAFVRITTNDPARTTYVFRVRGRYSRVPAPF